VIEEIPEPAEAPAEEPAAEKIPETVVEEPGAAPIIEEPKIVPIADEIVEEKPVKVPFFERETPKGVVESASGFVYGFARGYALIVDRTNKNWDIFFERTGIFVRDSARAYSMFGGRNIEIWKKVIEDTAGGAGNIIGNVIKGLGIVFGWLFQIAAATVGRIPRTYTMIIEKSVRSWGVIVGSVIGIFAAVFRFFIRYPVLLSAAIIVAACFIYIFDYALNGRIKKRLGK
jgi:hypothetical protein